MLPQLIRLLMKSHVYIYMYIMIGSTLGVCEPDEDGKGCQLPISNLFPQNQLIPLKKAALPFSQIPQEVPRFEVSANARLKEWQGCRQCQSGQVGFPDPCMKGDPVTTQLWLRKHFRKPTLHWLASSPSALRTTV